MDYFKSFKHEVLHLIPSDFDDLALKLFKYQAQNNPVYAGYIKNLKRDYRKIKAIKDIPFLPVEFFKTQKITCGAWEQQMVFESSGTNGYVPARHYIQDVTFYNTLAGRTFTSFFGPLNAYTILALLPSYMEKGNSSLINMVSYFIANAKLESGFYLKNLEELVRKITDARDKKIVLFGVAYALLDLAEYFPVDMHHVTIVETGGMKGKRKEIIRQELYAILKEKLKVKDIYSEYGMTELLSQAYAKNGIFNASATMKVFIREPNDPFSYVVHGKTGGINVIDLANIHSCAFVETKDLGKSHEDGSFEVLGRFDYSDIRGCNFLLNL
ncbi:MAG: acyl transferase [Bacteroidetes bacterium]|nr:acyl transferase [Bacteroidota bacterium]